MSLRSILSRYFYPGNYPNSIGGSIYGFGTIQEETELIAILNKAEIPYLRKIAVTGSQYWKVKGYAFRLSDHFKPDGEIYNGKEVSSWKELYNAIAEIPNIDLSDKSKRKSNFYKKVMANPSKYFSKKTFENGIKVFVIKGTNRMYENLNDAINSLYKITFTN